MHKLMDCRFILIIAITIIISCSPKEANHRPTPESIISEALQKQLNQAVSLDMVAVVPRKLS